MLVIRVAREEDVDQLYELIQKSAYGLTTLKISKEQLLERIQDSLFAFTRRWTRKTGQPYVFVMEDLTSGNVVGTCSIYSKVGGFEPFYSFQIKTTVHESKMLGVRKELKTLHLLKEHDGPTEIGSLFLAPDYRGSGNGRLLSLSRFMFMAQFPERFDDETIAEMRGDVSPDGISVFWNAIGSHFFEIEFPQAETLTTVSKNFIADLMPPHPIYISLLPEEAQERVGKVHKNTEPALALLEQENFEFREFVDIFDGGPVMHASTAEIRAVTESQVLEIDEIKDDIEGESLLISSCDINFRACIGDLQIVDGKARVSPVTALGLNLKVGDPLRYVSLRSSKVI